MKKLVNFLASSRLGLILFLLIATTSIFGTFIPQGASTAYYIHKYGSLGKVITYLSLNDLYHSWWYLALLILFSLNLTFCSIKRFPISWKRFKGLFKGLNYERFPKLIEVTYGNPYEKLKNCLIQKYSFKKLLEDEKSIVLVKRKYSFSFLMVYVVHASILVILLGAIWGGILGYRGTMVLLEGSKSNVVIPFKGREPIFLSFYLKLQKFVLERYPDGTPKAYISKVEVIDGKKHFFKEIRVNHPLKYRGVAFYQANYQVIPELEVEIQFNDKDLIKTINWITPQTILSRFVITLLKVGRYNGMLWASIKLQDVKTGKLYQGILIQGFPHFYVKLSKKVLRITLLGLKDVKYMSILEVTKDPGSWLVFTGFVLLILGMIGVYFFEPREVWIKLIREDESKTRVLAWMQKKRGKKETKSELEKFLKKFF
ncbi:MAG: cytochrome c biogenesis protein ResB [Thermodesulfobacteria bacterium]|nr:cytochrome c biogenesis protein ResB [Thermodesulfobacteriota bacterium]